MGTRRTYSSFHGGDSTTLILETFLRSIYSLNSSVDLCSNFEKSNFSQRCVYSFQGEYSLQRFVKANDFCAIIWKIKFLIHWNFVASNFSFSLIFSIKQLFFTITTSEIVVSTFSSLKQTEIRRMTMDKCPNN